MKKVSSLSLSSLLSVATLMWSATSAAAPVTPDDHLPLMYDLVLDLVGAEPAEERNIWASPSESCQITWPGGNNPSSARTKGACFLTLGLVRGHGLPASIGSAWWGSSSPSSAVYYDAIEAENRFYRVDSAMDALPGDILAVKYGGDGAAVQSYVMVVSQIEFFTTTPAGLDRYILEIVDSTRTVHGMQDTRWQGDPSTINGHVQGVGAGLIFIDADATTGEVVAHTWSNQGSMASSYYPNHTGPGGRSITIGRFDRNKLPGN